MSDHRRRRRERARQGRRRAHATTLEEKYFGTSTSGAPSIGAHDGYEAHRDPKALRLCRQVREQLDLVLAEFGDPTLEGTHVHEVGYVGGSHTIRVDVTAPAGADPTAVAARLDAVRGRLRAEIAAAIHRKRTPMLCFAVLPADWLEHWRERTESEEEGEDGHDHE